jgi:MFS transporter, DHA3 family, macrolide efflux protein
VQLQENRNEVNFLAAYLLSAFGYEFIFFVMTIYVYEVSQSALKVGIFAALTFLPRLFASFYGIVTDRYSRAKVFGWGAAITGLLVMAMVVSPTLAWIYVVWLFISVFLTFIMTTRTALMTEIMARDNYLRGNSLVLISLNIAKICAPLLAGIASAVFSIKSLFYLTGVIYFLVTLFCTRIDMPAVTAGQSERKIIAELKEGIKYMLASINLRFLISVGVLWRLFIGLQISLFVVYVKAHLVGSDASYGVFMTIIGVGSILGSFVGPWLVKRIPYFTLVFWGMSLHYVSFIVLGLLHSFNIALLVIFVGYVAFYATLVGFHSLRDKATQGDMRGRVYGSVSAILTPPAIVSMLAGGYLANEFGVANVFIGAGALALVSFYLLFWGRSIRADTENQFPSLNTSKI